MGNIVKSLFTANAAGLDVGSYNVKAAKLRVNRVTGERILNFGVSKINSSEQLGEAIVNASEQAIVKSESVNVTLSVPNIVLRYITMPYMSSASLSKALDFELEKYLPYKIEDMLIQHCVLSQLANKQSIVLLAAIEKKVVEKYLGVIKSVGLEVESVTVDVLALVKSFKLRIIEEKLHGPVALLDMGYRSSKLVVFENSVPYFSREIMTAGQAFDKLICEKMGIDVKEAEELKCRDKSKHKDIIDTVKPSLNLLIDELRLSFEYCERYLQKKVTNLFLTGGSSKLGGIDNFFGQSLNIKASIWDPAHSLKIPSSIVTEELKESSPLLGVVIGLAMPD